ncbi:hypothetical protein Q9L58_002691 [Maublancomyces gigas]|uniref:F-box domain-containing protein n=1 Tax=Discina gigas TaxID=1032678 RepID=A0ABR3GQN0_9PEZI
MSTPTNSTQLISLPAEILLGILKASPNLKTLSSLVQVNSDFYKLWKTNEYAVCQEIAKNISGALWQDLYNLLVFQGGLKRQADVTPDIQALFTGDYTASAETGWGVLEGGTRIGVAELYQLLQYIDKVRYCRAGLFSRPAVCGVLGISAEHKFVIDRAFLRYWVILLATAPQLISSDDRIAWAGRQGNEMAFLSSEYSTSDNAKERYLKEFQAVEPYLRYQGREKELIELARIAEASQGLLLFPGLQEEGGAHYCDRWVNGNYLQCLALKHIRRAAVLLGTAER